MITFVTAWYIADSKYDKKEYQQWIKNLLENVVKFNLVIFTDEKSKVMIEQYLHNNHRIKMIIYPKTEFYTYQWKENWEKNHSKSMYKLHKKIDWTLNMIWNEKISFIKKAYSQQYFKNGTWYGWMDIGYFRGRDCDLQNEKIKEWPNKFRVQELEKFKIHYGNVCGNQQEAFKLCNVFLNKNELGMPSTQVPEDNIFISGGFLLINKNSIDWWFQTYYKRLAEYFQHEYILKDDQVLLADLIVNNFDKFKIHTEFVEKKELLQWDNWFMFQRILL